MAQPDVAGGPAGIKSGPNKTIFERAPDAVSFYSNLINTVWNQNEAILQFYESVPDIPDANGTVELMRASLKATVLVTYDQLQVIQKMIEDILRRRAERIAEGTK